MADYHTDINIALAYGGELSYKLINPTDEPVGQHAYKEYFLNRHGSAYRHNAYDDAQALRKAYLAVSRVNKHTKHQYNQFS